MNKLIKRISDPKIFVFTIIWLMVLVFFGTIEQKDIGLFASQKKYFTSMILWVYGIPLPGGLLTMIILSMNLFSFFLKPNSWRKNKVGILTVHIGALILLIGSVFLILLTGNCFHLFPQDPH